MSYKPTAPIVSFIFFLFVSSYPVLGQTFQYVIDYKRVTDVNEFSQEFPALRIEFLLDSTAVSHFVDEVFVYGGYNDAITDFKASTIDGVLFQADIGNLDWHDFTGRGDVWISTHDSENPLENATLNLVLDWDGLTTEGAFTNQLEEFRVPGHGGSIAWDIQGTITQVPEPSAFSLASLVLLASLLRRRKRKRSN